MARRISSEAGNSVDIGDLDRVTTIRRRAAWDLPMRERLAQVHRLCKQLNAVKGAARVR